MRRFVIGSLACLAIMMVSSLAFGQHEHGDSLLDRASDSPRSTKHQEGLRVNPISRYAIIGATVHRDPQTPAKIETIVIENGKIISLGADLELPAGTKAIQATGKHVYAGFIDAFCELDIKFDPSKGTTYWNTQIRPQLQTGKQFSADDLDLKEMRKAGFTSALVAPKHGIIKGQSSLMMLAGDETEHAIIKENVAQHIRLTVAPGARGGGYPNSPMGAYALARQTMLDAQWYDQAWNASRSRPDVPLPETNDSLAALGPVIDGKQPVIIDSSNELFVMRADRFASEFGLNAIVRGNGNEYRRVRDIAKLNRSIILPINFPAAPDVSSPQRAADVSLETMMHWDHAPANPAILAKNEIKFVFSSFGIKKKADFLKQIRTAVDRGLPQTTALHAITLGPAKLFGVDHQMGTIEKNKIANLTILDHELFDKHAKVSSVCIDGTMYEFDHQHEPHLAGKWKLDGDTLAGKQLVIKESKGKLSGYFSDPQSDAKPKPDQVDDKKSDQQIKIKSLQRRGSRLTGSFRSDKFGKPGVSLFSIVVADEKTGTGQLTLPSGKVTPFSVTQTQSSSHDHDDESADDDDKSSDKKTPAKSLAASFPVNFPLGAYGRGASPSQPKDVLIKNVTIWSLDERGKVENGAILFGDGKVKQVFANGDAIPNIRTVIDGKGRHVTPGIIDCHSHMASDSGINESGQAITAEVRIGDMIDCDDMTIYRQIAGGVTTSNILHGSANPIGGQNQVIKLRWGSNEADMKFKGAPEGIKFALGENVKQSNWPNPTNRYPQTRMGVEQIIDDALRAAKDYQRRHQQYAANRNGLPPKRDLELEAIAEILDGKRWIHCHSYRQDEILALIETLDSHNITIGSFQHILEGYKVADAMAKHGAMASAFADWWAYKYEVKDAIPYAGALMYEAGIVVSFNSDDGELGRHLNQEAAKAVRYGNVPEVEALKFVTLNPAKQLRIENRVGSLEPGKDADLVLWSGHPLSNRSVVDQTWIDGRKYFDRTEDVKLQQRNRDQRIALIQKILASGQPMEKVDKSKIDPAKLWPRYDEFCGHHDHEDDHHHDDGH